MRKYVFTLLLLIVPLVLVTTSAAQQAPSIQISTINDDNFPQLELRVNVQDEMGFPVVDLTPEDVVVLMDSEFANVISVENITVEELPISVVLVIDTSQSIIGTPLEDTKAAALAFLDKLAPGDEVAVIDFDSQARIAQAFTDDLDAVRDVISGLQADGRTALYDANFEAAQLATSANTPRRFVIFLTDGNEYGNMSSSAPEAGTQLARENHIQLYTIGLGYSVNQPYLQDMATQTGGQFYLYPSSQQLTELYEYLASYLRTQYIVTIETNLEPDGAEHQITVNAAGANVTAPYTAIDLYPQIAVTGIPEGEIAEPITVAVDVEMPRGAQDAVVSIDGAPVEGLIVTPNADNTALSTQVTIDPMSFSPGTYTLSVQADDAAGGSRTTTSEFTIASLPPVFSISGIEPGMILSSETVDIAVSDAGSQSPLQQVTIAADGAALATLNEAPFSYTLDVLALGGGTHTIDVTAASSSGATSTVSIPITTDAALFFTPTFTPSITPTATSTSTLTATPTDTPTITPTPSDTPIQVTDTLTPTDTPTVTATFTPSPEPPAFSISGLEDGDIIDVPTVDIAIDVSDQGIPPEEVIVVVDTQELPPVTEPPYEYTLDILSLGEGDHTVEVTVTGANGISASESIGFSVDPLLFAPPPTDTPGPTDTATFTNTPRPTNTATATFTPTPTDTDTPTPTDTSTPEPTDTPADTDTPEPTDTPADTNTPEPTHTSLPTDTLEPTITSTPAPPAVEVPVQGEDEDNNLNSVLPIAGIILLLIIIVGGYLLRRRGDTSTT